MLPAEGLPLVVVHDREVRITSPATSNPERTLVGAIHVSAIQFVRDYDLGFGTYDFSPLRAMDKASFQEGLATPALDGAGDWIREPVRHPARDFGILGVRELARIGERALMQDDQPPCLPGQRRVQELARQEPTGAGTARTTASVWRRRSTATPLAAWRRRTCPARRADSHAPGSSSCRAICLGDPVRPAPVPACIRVAVVPRDRCPCSLRFPRPFPGASIETGRMQPSTPPGRLA